MVSCWLRTGLLLSLFLPMALALSNAGFLGPEAKVVAKPAPPKGDGVFAADKVSEGAFVCQYKGQLLTLEEEMELYPDRYPDYCLQLSPNLSIDGANSDHWSRLINHNQDAKVTTTIAVAILLLLLLPLLLLLLLLLPPPLLLLEEDAQQVSVIFFSQHN